MLEIKDISFSWSERPLLEDVSFTVESGEAVALLGPNGCGKTTLMKLLASICFPTSGSITADGINALRGTLRYRKMLGYLSENAAADNDMRVAKYLSYRAKLRGELSKKIPHRVQEAMSLCALNEYADNRIGNLSFGLRKRVALADAVLLRPRFLILDDLLAGLDPATRSSFSQILSAIGSFASVIASGHEIDELSRWCKKFLVLKNAHLTVTQSLPEARKLLGLPEGRSLASACEPILPAEGKSVNS